MSTFLEKLKKKISEISEAKNNFLSSVEIYYHNPNDDYSGIYHVGATLYHFGSNIDGHEVYQIELKAKFNEFINYFSLIECFLPEKKINELSKATTQILSWIEKKKGAPGPNVKSSIKMFDDELSKYLNVISLLDSANKSKDFILVLDTNALLNHPELSDYSTKFQHNINILIPPTVISELDKLKVFHRNEEVRNKAKSIISRLKGYRNQGDVIIEGVQISKSIRLKMLAIEPNFNKTLSWLDATNLDDRIIVTLLDIETHNLSSEVLFITSDLNLQNKATLAGINFRDIDEIFS